MVLKNVLVLLWFSCLVCFLGTGSALAKDLKIGVVDLQSALNQSSKGKAARAEFSRRANELQAHIEQKQRALETMKNELLAKLSVLSEKASAEKEKQYQEKLKDFQRFYRDAQDELRAKDQELTGHLLRELQTIVAQIGQQGGYTIILERGESSVIFMDKDIDITRAVINTFNKS